MPKSGEVRRTALPPTFDGIRFEIGRMVFYVQEASKDPFMIEHTRKVCQEFSSMMDQAAQMNGGSLAGTSPALLAVGAIDAWCRAHFCYVNDPPNIEVIQTPTRMVKQSQVPATVIRDIIQPFYQAMETVAEPGQVQDYEPPGICYGDCDEGGILFMSQCACAPAPADLKPLRFRFGGHEDTLHHVWDRVKAGDEWIDSDLTEEGYNLGDFSKFPHYEEVEVPL
jgi:hypothetical protein